MQTAKKGMTVTEARQYKNHDLFSLLIAVLEIKTRKGGANIKNRIDKIGTIKIDPKKIFIKVVEIEKGKGDSTVLSKYFKSGFSKNELS